MMVNDPTGLLPNLGEDDDWDDSSSTSKFDSDDDFGYSDEIVIDMPAGWPRRQGDIGRTRLDLEKVRRNNPECSTLSFSDSLISNQIDTDLHLSLGNALMGNTNLRTLCISRGYLRAEESAQAVARGIGQSKLASLKLKSVSVWPTQRPPGGQEAAAGRFWQTLYKGLQSSQTLKHLYVRNAHRSEGFLVLGDALPQMHSLRQLHLRFWTLDEASAQALANGLGSSKIVSLKIVAMTWGPTTTMWQILGQGLQSMQAIEELHLKNISLMQATSCLKDALPLMPSLRKLILKQWDWTEPIAQALADGIGKSKLQSLTILSDDLGEESARISEILFQGFSASTTIEELNVSSVLVEEVVKLGFPFSSVPLLRTLIVSNHLVLTTTTAKTLVRGIRQAMLERLELSNPIREELGPLEEYGHVRRIFFQGLQTCPTLKHLVISGEYPFNEDDGLSVGFSSIETLRFFNFDIRPKYGRLFCDALVSNSTLTKLELNQMTVRGETGLCLLVQGLRSSASITSLVLKDFYRTSPFGRFLDILFTEGLLDQVSSLQHLTMQTCRLDDESVRLLVKHWPANSPVQSLCLGNNEIQATGAQLLLRAAREHVALRRLDLSHNGIGYEGLRIVGEELAHQQHLTHVMLDSCLTWTHHEDPNSDLAIAQDRARCLAGRTLSDSVEQNQYLRHLYVAGNGFHPRVECEIGFHMSLNRKGRYLLSTNPALPSTVWCHVFAKCCDSEQFGTSLLLYYLQQQPYLAQPPIQTKDCKVSAKEEN